MSDENEPQTQTDGVYEMLWDCKHCGAAKLLGLTHRHCPNCGSPQNAEARYFPTDEEKIKVENHVFHGKDIECRYCRAYNGRASKHCRECGSPLSEGSDGKTRGDVTHAEGQFTPAAARNPQGVAVPTQPKRPRSRNWLWGVVGGALLAFVLVTIFWKKEQTLEVSEQTWQREIDVEVFGPVKESTWCDSLPQGVKELRRYTAVRSHEKVADGEDCTVRKIDQGDGTMREEKTCKPRFKEKPVEDQKCDYQIDKWSVRDTQRSLGTGTSPEPAWPELKLGSACNRVGCLREGKRRESYAVQFRGANGDGTKECQVDERKWRGFAVGQKYAARVGVISSALDCGSLQRR